MKYSIALFCAFILSLLFVAGFLQPIQLQLADQLYGGKVPLEDVVVVAIDDRSLQELGRWPWSRERFATVLHELSNAELIAIDVAFFEPSPHDDVLADALTGPVVLASEFTNFTEQNADLLMPVFEQPMGYVNVLTDHDGVTRAVDQSMQEDSFAGAVYRHVTGKQPPRSSRYLINFVGPPYTFTYHSFSDVYYNRTSTFDDKIVFIGASAPGLHDNYFVPTSRGQAMPGVEVHANAFQTLMLDNPLTPQPAWAVILCIFAAGLLITWFVDKGVLWQAGLGAVILVFAWIFVAIAAFDDGLLPNLVYVPLTIVITFAAVVSYSYLIEEREKKKMHEALSKYVSKEVIEEVMEDSRKLNLGGERREVTVFFSDVRGFTTISEKLSPERLVQLLNEYLSEMTAIILSQEGVVDKFIGDAIMAFWGAPLKQPDHAQRAALTSLTMRERLQVLRRNWKKHKLPDIDIGIGLHTGPAVVGNMGSYDRFDYTAMGDTVNLASRLEGITKQYGVGIVCSERTAQRLRGITLRKLDRIRVKGRGEPITIFEIVGKQVSKAEKVCIIAFEQGLEQYFNRKWESAIRSFKKAGDRPAQVFIDRCKAFQRSPPPKGWDGVWDFKTK